MLTVKEDRRRDEIAQTLGTLARLGGGAILSIVEDGVAASRKLDGSACTNADVAAEKVILAGLGAQFPGISVVAEESGAPPNCVLDRFFLVDPLDGTSDFIDGSGSYTVNIALIEHGTPVVGAIYAPARRQLWIGGEHAFTAVAPPDATPLPADAWQELRARHAPHEGLVALASLRHADSETESFLGRLPVHERKSASSSLKFCAVASGEADVYPRFGPTMEWDTAAGDAIVRAAGGLVTDQRGAPLRYGHAERSFRNGPFIVWGDPLAPERFACA